MEVRLWRGLDRVEVTSIVDRQLMPYVPLSENGHFRAETFDPYVNQRFLGGLH